MATIKKHGTDLLIETDSFTAAIATEGYTSGTKSGTMRDKKTGATDLGHGLDIADFLLEPAGDRPPDPINPYRSGDPLHGNILKRYVALPQICTQARKLPHEIYRGDGFVAVKQWFTWPEAAEGYEPGSHWEQTLVFPDGQRYFFSSDRITSAVDSDALVFRLDLPGHLKHQKADNFSAIYLSYLGEISSNEFLEDFAPDDKFLYRRDDTRIPDRMIRGYRARVPDGNGPWLAGLTLAPEAVYEGWTHQRGYVCFIMEIGGHTIRKDQQFGAAYAIGFFDSVQEMEEVYDSLKGKTGIQVEGEPGQASWRWTTD